MARSDNEQGARTLQEVWVYFRLGICRPACEGLTISCVSEEQGTSCAKCLMIVGAPPCKPQPQRRAGGELGPTERPVSLFWALSYPQLAREKPAKFQIILIHKQLFRCEQASREFPRWLSHHAVVQGPPHFQPCGLLYDGVTRTRRSGQTQQQ